MRTQLHDITWQYFRSVQSLWSMILLDKTIILHDLGNTVLGQAMFFTHHRKTTRAVHCKVTLLPRAHLLKCRLLHRTWCGLCRSHRNGDDFGMIKWHWVYNVHDKKGKLLKEMMIMFFFSICVFARIALGIFAGPYCEVTHWEKMVSGIFQKVVRFQFRERP